MVGGCLNVNIFVDKYNSMQYNNNNNNNNNFNCVEIDILFWPDFHRFMTNAVKCFCFVK